MPPSDLAAATRVTPVAHAPGWYTADLPNAWSYLTPSGGVLMTVAMRAMAAELGDDALHPVSATTVFMSRVPAGPLAVRVEVLRRGNAACQVRAVARSARPRRRSRPPRTQRPPPTTPRSPCSSRAARPASPRPLPSPPAR